jgi:hypothetical protein
LAGPVDSAMRKGVDGDTRTTLEQRTTNNGKRKQLYAEEKIEDAKAQSTASGRWPVLAEAIANDALFFQHGSNSIARFKKSLRLCVLEFSSAYN